VKDDRAELRELLVAKAREESAKHRTKYTEHGLWRSSSNDTAHRKELRDIVSQQVPELAPATIELKEYIEAHGDKKLSAAQRGQLEQVKGMAGFYSLGIAASSILAGSRKLISHYQNLNDEDQKQHLQGLLDMRETWKEDKKAVGILLDKGKRVCQRRIQRLIPEGVQSARKSLVNLKAADNDEFSPQQRSEDLRLHTSFQQTARGVRRIVRDLPKAR
jgi:membrane-associated HD superfamily phosphohydrolase